MSTPPFLPSSARARDPRLRRTLLLWALLVIMFVAIYELFTGPPSASAAHPSAASSPSFSWIVAIACAVACGGFCIAWVWMVVRLRRGAVLNGEGLRLLARGELDQAQALFEGMAKKYHSVPTLRAMALHNVAWTLVRRGELHRGLHVLVGVAQGSALASFKLLKPSVAANLAAIYALLGELDAAAQWATEAEALRERSADPRPLLGSIALSRAIIDCRRGEHAEALRRLDHEWGVLEEAVTGETLRPLRLVRAFALSQTSGPRDGGAVDSVLAPLREGRSDTLRYLGTEWPELRGFMHAHSI
jgi:hypothetical protein